MKTAARMLGAGCVFLGLSASGVQGQTLSESCPGIADDLGGLIGFLVDDDSEMALPGASATVRFETADGPQEITTEAGLDGVYRLCGVPVGVALELVGNFAAFSSAPMPHTMTDNFERVDLGISMVASAGSGPPRAVEDRILMCPEQLGAARLFLCQEGWHLEQCEYTDLGTVRASRTGSGGRNATRELFDDLYTEAKRVKAHAILNPRSRMDQSGDESVIGEITGQAVAFDDPNCRGSG